MRSVVAVSILGGSISGAARAADARGFAAACVERAWFVDRDGDGYGDASSPILACEHPVGTTYIGLDCNDRHPYVHPDAVEQCSDAIDSDCSGRPSNGCEVTLLSEVAKTYWDSEASSGLGNRVANAGDLDGDGRDDLVVGAANTGYTGPLPKFAGTAYVVYGASDLTGSAEIESSYGARIDGDAEYEQAGSDVAGVGDLDSDGYDDLALSSSGDDLVTCLGCGDVRVFYGPVSGDLALEDGDVALTSMAVDSVFGNHIAQGDFDDDDQDDLIVSSYAVRRTAGGAAYDGAVYFFSAPLDAGIQPRDANATFEGGPNSMAGRGVASMADDDGDGIADLAIGAPSQSDIHGVVMIVHGPIEGTMTPASADVVYTTSQARTGGLHFHGGDALGEGVEWSGDVDGDGHVDLAMTAHDSNLGGYWSGAVYVVNGPHEESINVRDSDAIVYGHDSGVRLGWGLAEGTDLDGDGFDDVVVGSLWDDISSYGAGTALVFYGPVFGQRSSDAADVILSGESGDQAGADVDTLDFDGDGAPELLVGANEGETVYVVPNSVF